MKKIIWARVERPDVPEFLTLDEAAELLRVDGLSMAMAVTLGDVPATIGDEGLVIDSTQLFAAFGLKLVRRRDEQQ